MFHKAFPRRHLVAVVLALATGLAFAQVKPRIDRAADLPRFSYKIDGKVEDVVRSTERFALFAAAVRRDTESVLAGYDIADKSTRRCLTPRSRTTSRAPRPMPS